MTDTLGPTTDLSFGRLAGRISQLTVEDTMLSFSFHGWADGLLNDTGDGPRSLMPTRWQSISSLGRVGVLAAAALLGFMLVALAHRAFPLRRRTT
jgi:hypothetical protein